MAPKITYPGSSKDQTLTYCLQSGFPGGTVVKNLSANAGGIKDLGSIPGLERSPGGGYGNSLQYSCLENPMDRAVGWVTVHGVTKR